MQAQPGSLEAASNAFGNVPVARLCLWHLDLNAMETEGSGAGPVGEAGWETGGCVEGDA